MDEDISDEKLKSFAYNKLRSLAAKLGIGGNGTKVALIKRISDHRNSIGGFGQNEGPDPCIADETEPAAETVDSSNVKVNPSVQASSVAPNQSQTVAPSPTAVKIPRESWFRTVDDAEVDSALSSAVVTPEKNEICLVEDTTAEVIRKDVDLTALLNFYGQMSTQFQRIYRCEAPASMTRAQFDALGFPEVKPRKVVAAPAVASPVKPSTSVAAPQSARRGAKQGRFTPAAAPKSVTKGPATSPMRSAVASAKKVALVVKTPAQTAAKAAKSIRRSIRTASKLAMGRNLAATIDLGDDDNASVISASAVVNLNTSIDSNVSLVLCSSDDVDVSLMSNASSAVGDEPVAVAPTPVGPRSRVLAMASAINKKQTSGMAKPKVSARVAVSTAATRGVRSGRTVIATGRAADHKDPGSSVSAPAAPETTTDAPEPVEAVAQSAAVSSKPATKSVAPITSVPSTAEQLATATPSTNDVPNTTSKPKPTSVLPASTAKRAREAVMAVALASVTKPCEKSVSVPLVASTPLASVAKPKRPDDQAAATRVSAVKCTPKAKVARTVPPSTRPCASVASTPLTSAVNQPAAEAAPITSTPASRPALTIEPEAPAENPLAWAMLSSPVRNDLRDQSKSFADADEDSSEYNLTPVKDKHVPPAATPSTAAARVDATPKSTPLNPKRTQNLATSAYKTPVVKASAMAPAKSAMKPVSKTPLSSRAPTSGIKTPLASAGSSVSRSLTKSVQLHSSSLHSARKPLGGGNTALKQVMSQSITNSSRAVMLGVSAQTTFKPNIHSSLLSTAAKKASATARFAATVKKPTGFKPLTENSLNSTANKENAVNTSASVSMPPQVVKEAVAPAVDENVGVNPFLSLIAE